MDDPVDQDLEQAVERAVAKIIRLPRRLAPVPEQSPEEYAEARRFRARAEAVNAFYLTPQPAPAPPARTEASLSGMNPPRIVLREEDLRNLCLYGFQLKKVISWFAPDLTIAELEMYRHVVWYDRGRLHREDGPALVSKLVYGEAWFRRGRLHRQGGPALATAAYEAWYEDGHKLREVGDDPEAG